MYSRQYLILVIFIIAVAVLIAHGWALNDGLFLDDHWHRLHWTSQDWSLASALDSTTINPERFLDIWWQDKAVQWQYSRPAAVYLTQAVYHCSGGSVKALHAVGLVLHGLCALMVHHLCLRITRRRLWAVVGALLFVVYSHSVFAVAWLAAHNAVLQTALMLGALVCYIRASGLNLYAGNGDEGRSKTAPRLQISLFVVTLVLWGLSLLSRENAAVFPVLAIAFDLAFGGRRYLRARWGGYLAMVAILSVFLIWRLGFFYHPLPDFYVRRYDGPAYIAWWIAKLLHYLTCVLWLSPMAVGPTGRFDPWSEVPGDCLLMVFIVCVMSVGYWLAARRARGWWIWPMWILLSILPVVPVVATPHSGYMPGVGFAIALATAAGLHDRIRPVGIGRYSRGVAIYFLVATSCYMPIYRTLWRAVVAAERYTIADVASWEPPAEPTEVFFINLPFVNVYAQPHLQQVWRQQSSDFKRDDLRCHVLTFSPDVLGLEAGGRIEQRDTHTFVIAATGQAWFSGALGRFLIEAMRSQGAFKVGDRIATQEFDAEITASGPVGIGEIRFRFKEPLISPRYRFYMTTSQGGTVCVPFDDWSDRQGPMVIDLSSLPVAAPEPDGGPELRRMRDRYAKILDVARRIIRSDLYLTGPAFPGPR